MKNYKKKLLVFLQISSKKDAFCRTAEHILFGIDTDAATL